MPNVVRGKFPAIPVRYADVRDDLKSLPPRDTQLPAAFDMFPIGDSLMQIDAVVPVEIAVAFVELLQSIRADPVNRASTEAAVGAPLVG
jgi:hypothetical protein